MASEELTQQDVAKISFAERFLNLMSELKAPKNQYNKFGKYNYRSSEDILEAVKPLALKYQLIPNLTDELVIIGNRYYIKATASITDGKETFSATGYAREEENKKGMDGSQITGTASSYARKYAMNGLYQIDDSKDADTDEFSHQNKSQSSTKQELASSKQVGMLKAKVIEYCNKNNGEQSMLEQFLSNTFKVNSIYEADKKTTSNMINYLVEKLEQKA